MPIEQNLTDHQDEVSGYYSEVVCEYIDLLEHATFQGMSNICSINIDCRTLYPLDNH